MLLAKVDTYNPVGSSGNFSKFFWYVLKIPVGLHLSITTESAFLVW